MTTGIYHKRNIAGQLRTVMLGSFYGPEYFEFINDDNIRNPLQRVAVEINQDLDYFHQKLQSHGVTVLRPGLMPVEKFQNFFKSQGYFAPPPLQPRNHHAVLGDQCYQFNVDETDFISQCLQLYNTDIVDLSDSNEKFFSHSMDQNASNYNADTDTWYRKQKYQSLAGPDWPSFDHYVNGDRSNITDIQQELAEFELVLKYETKELSPIQAPNFMVIGNRLVIDSNEYCDYVEWSKEHIPGFDVYDSINTTAGHTDGAFVIVGRNVIVGIDMVIDYHRHFPGYSIVNAGLESHQDISYQYGQQNKIKAWFIDGENRNKPLQDYIDKYFERYTGFSSETVFDVNILALDSDNVFITSENAETIDALAKKGINCIRIPWRHRRFVDCGLHCLTLDLHRDD